MNADDKLKAIREIVESDELCADAMVAKVGEVLDDSPKLMPSSKLNRRRMLDVIHAMDVVMRSLNDENLMYEWLAFGVPDGTNEQSDVDELYGDQSDGELENDYEELAAIFAILVKAAVEDGTRHYLCHS